MLLSWRFGLGIVVAFLLGVVLFGCAVGPRPANAPPLTCGPGDREWTFARVETNTTRILARDSWDSWLLGRVVAFPGKVEVHRNVRIEPWAGGKGAYLHLDGSKWDAYLVSADARGCFFLGLDSALLLFRYNGPAELIYLRVRGGWVVVNPHGGPAF